MLEFRQIRLYGVIVAGLLLVNMGCDDDPKDRPLNMYSARIVDLSSTVAKKHIQSDVWSLMTWATAVPTGVLLYQPDLSTVRVFPLVHAKDGTGTMLSFGPGELVSDPKNIAKQFKKGGVYELHEGLLDIKITVSKAYDDIGTIEVHSDDQGLVIEYKSEEGYLY